MIKEFKEFIAKGNVLDLAVGLIMATYFGAIIKSFVDDVLMPPIGLLIGGVDFKDLKIAIGSKTAEDGTIAEVFLNYGSFINTVITFVIVAFAVFLLVKAYNTMQKKKEEAPAPAAPPAPSNEEKLLGEIRDLLRNK
jgi:large conductance mechanosensitive channel